jgi:hypothetical protein
LFALIAYRPHTGHTQPGSLPTQPQQPRPAHVHRRHSLRRIRGTAHAPRRITPATSHTSHCCGQPCRLR